MNLHAALSFCVPTGVHCRIAVMYIVIKFLFSEAFHNDFHSGCQNNPGQNENAGGPTIPAFKFYYRITVIKSA